MNGTSNPVHMVDSFSYKGLFAFAFPYAFVLTSLYLYMFWRPLGINPFGYANAIELVSGTLGGSMISMLAMGVGVAIGLLHNELVSSAATNTHTENRAENRPIPRYVFVLAAALVIACIYCWLVGDPNKWLTTGAIVAALFPAVIPYIKPLDDALPTLNARLFFCGLVFLVPCGFMSAGGNDLAKALNPKRGFHVDCFKSSLNDECTVAYMYVGTLGDYHVLRNTASETTVLLPTGMKLVIQSNRDVRDSRLRFISPKEVAPQ